MAALLDRRVATVATGERRKRWPWVVGGLILLGLGAWLSWEPPPKRDHGTQLNFPRQMVAAEQQRAEARRTWVPPPMPDAGEALPSVPRDPLHAAFPPTLERGAVVLEVNAIRHSALGEKLVACLSANAGEGLERFRDAGFDPFSQLDRVALADDVLMVSGDFKNVKWDGLPPSRGYGRDGELREVPSGSDGGTRTMGVWKNQLAVLGEEAEVKAALDRLQAGGTPQTSAVPESLAYGEIYGVLQPPGVLELFRGDPALEALAKRAASSIELHVDVSSDVGVVADVKGQSAQDTNDLRLALSSALSLAKLKAKSDGQVDQAEVLGTARALQVEGSGKQFRLEAGIPQALLDRRLEECVARGLAKRAVRVDAPRK